MCTVGDRCPQQSECGGAHAKSELLTVGEVSALCDLASDWRKYGVPLAWQHLAQHAGHDLLARESQSPPPLPSSDEPRSPSEPPPPLPDDSVLDRAPSPGSRLPPVPDDLTGTETSRGQQQGSPPPPPLPSGSPHSSPSPRPPQEAGVQPRYSPVYGLPAYHNQQPWYRPGSPSDYSRLRPYQPRSPLHSPSSRFGSLHWPQSGYLARPPADPGSPLYSPPYSRPYSVASPSYGRRAREETPPNLTTYPPLPELRDLPPLGSAQEAWYASQTHSRAYADLEADTAQHGEGGNGRPYGLYHATDEAHALLARGIDPLHRHRHPDYSFVCSIRTRLCDYGAACTRHGFCTYAHSDEELLTRDDNILLMEVAREWDLHGVPSEGDRFFEALATAQEGPPARTMMAAAEARRENVDTVAPEDGPCESGDVQPMAPPSPQPELQQRAEPLPAKPQDLPPSMRNEDLEVEESLMKVVQVRVLYSRLTCSRSGSCCTSAHLCIYPSTSPT